MFTTVEYKHGVLVVPTDKHNVVLCWDQTEYNNSHGGVLPAHCIWNHGVAREFVLAMNEG